MAKNANNILKSLKHCGIYAELKCAHVSHELCPLHKCRDSLKRWPAASKIMDRPVKMNTEWSVWPVHVLGPVEPAFFNRHSLTLVCFYSIRDVLPCCDENRKTEIITNQIFHFLVVIFRFAVSLSGDCRSRRNR